jgi:hypothetical protein
MHCHPLSVPAVVVLTLVFSIGLAETSPADWSHSEGFLFALFYLFWAGHIITIYCYWSGFPSGPQSPPPVTYVGILLTQEVLLLRLYFSILTIPVQTVIRSCTHNHTTYLVCSHDNQHICFNSTYCPQDQWLEIKSIHNPGNLVSCTQVFSPDKPVSMFFWYMYSHRQRRMWRYRLWLWGSSLGKILCVKR